MPQEFNNLSLILTNLLGGIFAAGILIAVGIFLIFSLMILFFQTFTLMFGARFVDIKDRTFGKALIATFLYIFVGSIPCIILFIIAWPLGIMAFLILPCFIIKWVYDCSLAQAFFASITSIATSLILVVGFIIGMVFVIKNSLDQKKNSNLENVSKIEIKEQHLMPETSTPIEIQKSTKVHEVQPTFVPIKTENKPIQKQNKVVIKEAPPKKEIAKKSLPEKAIAKTPTKVTTKTSIKVSNSSKQKKSSVKVAAKPKPKAKSSEKKPLPAKRLKNT